MARQFTQDEWDEEALRCAALVLQRRSRNPRSFTLRVLVRLLNKAADGIGRGER
jgi:hypothetical protein